MENTMIERVARALAMADDFVSCNAAQTKTEYADRAWRSYVPRARAAIAAMRDRDESMLDAGTAVLWPYVQQLAPGSTAVAVYGAMIDAALDRVSA